MKYTSIVALTLFAAVPALAQNDLSWVSQRSGNDANDCLFVTPCLTFQGAYNKTASGGIIKAIDAGKYGTVSITQPITIDGNGVGAVIEANSSSVSAVSVNTSVAGPVEIRNLGIHLGTACSAFCSAINSMNSKLSIEDVSITGVQYIGVYVTGGSATIHGLTVTGSGAGGAATSAGIRIGDATATITDSVVRYSGTGIELAGFTAVTQALIERSQMISNGAGLTVENAGFAAIARISDCVITGNTFGVQTTGGGQIITFRNNTWAGNTIDGSTPFSISLK